ncbi:MAG: MucB/RseB C-terminal domain-containing protein [Planctomycetota bacterium]|jgi:negative regulator of sigma E activity
MRKLIVLAIVLAALAAGAYAAVTKIQRDNLRSHLSRMIEAEKDATYSAIAVRTGKRDDHEFTVRLRIRRKAPDKKSVDFLDRSSRGGEERSKEKDHRRGPRGPFSGDDLKDSLGLTDDQVGQINRIAEGMHEQMRSFFEKGEKPDREKMKEMFKKTENEIRAILTDEQKAQFDKFTKERPRHRGPRGPRRGFGRGGPPILDVDLLLENYDVRVEGTETVAGRPCRKIAVRPRFEGRPTCTLWSDEERSLMMKFRSEHSAFEYESIEFDAVIDDKEFERKKHRSGKPRDSHHRSVTLDEAKELVSFPLARPEWLPEGFRFHEATYMKRDSFESLHALYTDGLATVSLMECPEGAGWGPPWMKSKKKKKKDTHKAGRYRRGNVTMLTVALEGVTVTVVGSIPEQDLVDLLSSLTIDR